MSLEKYREDGQHLTLSSLEVELRNEGIDNDYITKRNIPTYPRPELHVSHVSHDTDLNGFWNIMEEEGFRDPDAECPYSNNPGPKVVWFSLTTSPQDLRDAGNRDMMLVHPGGRQQVLRPKGCGGYVYDRYGRMKKELEGPLPVGGTLCDFATSPAFSSRSRYGSFRFTFSLGDVLTKYSQQFCRGWKPVLRVFRTVVYKQEVMYAVLVHSPLNNRKFSRFPRLEHMSDVCEFRNGPKPYFVWRPQAMSGAHRVGLKVDSGSLYSQKTVHEYYMWDNVALALHVGIKSLEFEVDELGESVMFCKEDGVSVRKAGQPVTFQRYKKARAEVRRWWPNHPLPKFNKSYFHFFNYGM